MRSMGEGRTAGTDVLPPPALRATFPPAGEDRFLLRRLVQG